MILSSVLEFLGVSQTALPQPKPKPLQPAQVTSPFENLFRAGIKALHYVAPSSGRLALQNICIKNNTLYGCDGHRAIAVKVNVPFDDVVLPARLFKDVKHSTVRTITVSKDKKWLLINGKVYPYPLIPEAYPDMQEVIPKTFSHELRLSRQQLMTAVNSALSQSEEKKHGLVFKFRAGRISISPMNPRTGHAVPQVLNVLGNGSSFDDFGVDGKFLMRILHDLSGDVVVLKKNSPLQSIMFESADSDTVRFLLMPLRIQEVVNRYRQAA